MLLCHSNFEHRWHTLYPLLSIKDHWPGLEPCSAMPVDAAWETWAIEGRTETCECAKGKSEIRLRWHTRGRQVYGHGSERGVSMATWLRPFLSCRASSSRSATLSVA